jgi:hypothetical protein
MIIVRYDMFTKIKSPLKSMFLNYSYRRIIRRKKCKTDSKFETAAFLLYLCEFFSFQSQT